MAFVDDLGKYVSIGLTTYKTIKSARKPATPTPLPSSSGGGKSMAGVLVVGGLVLAGIVLVAVLKR